MVAYLFFFYYLIASPAYYCIRDLGRFRQCFAGLFTLYGVSFMMYTYFPAIGPCYCVNRSPDLDGGWLTQIAQPLVHGGSNGVDVFPSVHVAASLYLLVFDWWHYRARFWRVLFPCVAMWLSTVYLGYHYVVDLLAGALVAAGSLVVARLYARSHVGDHAPSFGRSTQPRFWRRSATSQHSTAQTKPTVQPARTSVG